MNTSPGIAVIGGDARQVFAADHLAHHGYPIMTYGLCARPQIARICNSYGEAPPAVITNGMSNT